MLLDSRICFLNSCKNLQVFAFEEYGKMRIIQTRFAQGILFLLPIDIQPRSHVFYER